MTENGTRNFSENTTTVKLWEGLKQNDTISVYVDIKEEDLTNTDQFGKKTFEIPVADIILSDNPEYYENNTMTVYDGSDYVTVTFRFVPNMRRID